MCSLENVPKNLCLRCPANAEGVWRRRQLRRRVDLIPWPSGPRWRAASGDIEADDVGGTRPGRHKRLRVVGRLGEQHAVGISQAAPHPRYGPVGRLAQGSANTRSHRYRSERWRGSLGQGHRVFFPQFVKHGRVWWAEILGEADGVEELGVVKHGRVWKAAILGKADWVDEVGVGQPESHGWCKRDGRMVKDRTRWHLRHRGGVCQDQPFAAVPTVQPHDAGIAVPMAGTALSGRLQDFTVQPGARPSEALRGVRKVGHAQGCRVRPHRASLAGHP